jgi:hypothetical protein
MPRLQPCQHGSWHGQIGLLAYMPDNAAVCCSSFTRCNCQVTAHTSAVVCSPVTVGTTFPAKTACMAFSQLIPAKLPDPSFHVECLFHGFAVLKGVLWDRSS